MTLPVIENRWTTGNILTLAAIIVQLAVLSFGGIWYQSKIDERIQKNAKDILVLEDNQKSIRSRIESSEAQYGRMDERLIAMQAVLLKIDRQMERLTP